MPTLPASEPETTEKPALKGEVVAEIPSDGIDLELWEQGPQGSRGSAGLRLARLSGSGPPFLAGPCQPTAIHRERPDRYQRQIPQVCHMARRRIGIPDGAVPRPECANAADSPLPYAGSKTYPPGVEVPPKPTSCALANACRERLKSHPAKGYQASLNAVTPKLCCRNSSVSYNYYLCVPFTHIQSPAALHESVDFP